MEDKELDHRGCESLTSKEEIFNFMLNFTRQLRSDCNFEVSVIIEHMDCSKFDLPWSHVREDEKRLYIYTEHCGFFWFYKEDLEEIRETVSTVADNGEDFIIISDKITVFDCG